MELNGQYIVDRLKLYTGYQGYNSPLTDFKFQKFSNGTWVDIIDIAGNTDPLFSTCFKPDTVNQVRLYVTAATGGIVRLYEMELFGKSHITSDINNPVAEHKFSVFPNPVKDLLYIKGNVEMVQIEIFDTMGRMILNTKAINLIDLSKLHPGGYVLRIDKSHYFRVLKTSR